MKVSKGKRFNIAYILTLISSGRHCRRDGVNPRLSDGFVSCVCSQPSREVLVVLKCPKDYAALRISFPPAERQKIHEECGAATIAGSGGGYPHDHQVHRTLNLANTEAKERDT